MAQVCEGFSKQTLMGNWFEERKAPVQDHTQRLENAKPREQEIDISVACTTGNIVGLPRVKRAVPWNSQGVMFDHGFREFKTTNNTLYDGQFINNFQNVNDRRTFNQVIQQRIIAPDVNPYQINVKPVQRQRTLTMGNTYEIYKQRKEHLNVSDFGSTFQKNQETKNKLLDLTSYNASYSRPLQEITKSVIDKHLNQQNQFAGLNVKDEKKDDEQAIQIKTVLVGEVYNKNDDPQLNTSIQRSWLPYKERSLSVADANLNKTRATIETNQINIANDLQIYKRAISQTQAYDNANSLPIEDGIHKFKPRYNTPGNYRHQRSDITRYVNQTLCNR